MFSDAIEKLRGFFLRTLRPAWRSLFSARLNFINLFAAILILEVLLGVILLSFSGNLAAEVKAAGLADGLFSESGTVDADARGTAAELMRAGLDAMRGKGLRVFVVSLSAWLGLSTFVLYKMFSSSVELGRVVWGLYLTFGADSRRLRRLLFWQLLSIGGLGLVVSLPISYVICATVHGTSGRFDLSPLGVLIIVGVTLFVFSLVLGLISRRIVGKSCISLLNGEGDATVIASPKRSSRKLSADRPLYLAATAMRRMWRHYLTTALCATLPLCLFFSCLSMARSGELRRDGEVTAFTLSFPAGFDSTDYTDLFKNDLSTIFGITNSSINGCGTASDLGLNLMLRPDEPAENAETVGAYGGAAAENFFYLCADPYTLAAEHYSLTTDPALYEASPVCDNGVERVLITVPEKGHFRYIYPRESFWTPTEILPAQLIPERDEPIFFAYPDPTLPTLAELAESDRYGAVLLAEENQRVDGVRNELGFKEQRLLLPYILLHPEDFKRLTGVDPSANIAAGLPTPNIAMFEVGGYMVTELDSFYRDLIDVEKAPSAPLVNDFSVAVADAYSLSLYGLDPETVLPSSAGEAAYIRSGKSCVGKLPEYLTLSTPVSVKGVSVVGSEPSPLELLEPAPKEIQYYSRYAVVSGEVAPELERDLLLLHPTDYAALFGRVSPYSEIYLDIESDTDIAELPALLLELAAWSNGYFPDGRPSLTVSDALWDILLTENGHYGALLWVIAVLLGLSVPFVWFYPQYNFYRRRRDEFFVISAIGGTRRKLFSVLLGEGLLLAGLAALIAVVLCPSFNAVFFGLSNAFLRLPLANSLFDPAAAVASAVASALCAGAVTVINAQMLLRKAGN